MGTDTFSTTVDTVADKDEADQGETEAVKPIRIRFRDGAGLCVTIECFHTALEDVVGSVFHIVGIRELQAEPEAHAKLTREWGSGLAPLQQDSVGVRARPVATRSATPSNVLLDLINQRARGDVANAEQPQPPPVSTARSEVSNDSNSSRPSRRSSNSGPRSGSINVGMAQKPQELQGRPQGVIRMCCQSGMDTQSLNCELTSVCRSRR